MNKEEIKKFSTLSFEDFKDLAKDDSLSPIQKIGFPNSYREGTEEIIFKDILSKNPIMLEENKVILDIGPGCSSLIHMIIDLCEKQNHQLILIDSKEMLDLLPEKDFVKKIPGYYPKETLDFINEKSESIDCIISYSVFHYIFTEGNIYNFIDKTLSLLAPGGNFLLGDIPNVSKRKRFFATKAGVRFHQDYTKSETLPDPLTFDIHQEKVDDGVIFGILSRYRNFGFETYLQPQPDSLPMSNRREDILFRKF